MEGLNKRVFDGSCVYWSDNVHHNVLVLHNLEQWANDMVRERGYMFLRDIYERLGLRVDKNSCLSGWTYEEAGIRDVVVIDITELRNGALLLKFNATSIIDRFN